MVDRSYRGSYRCLMRNDRELLGGNPSVYPGHPGTVAYLITQHYSCLTDALKGTKDKPPAIENTDIPGAGGNVYQALHVLSFVGVYGVDAAMNLAENHWNHCDSQASSTQYQDRYHAGIKQFRMILPKLREVLKTWDCSRPPYPKEALP